MTIKNLIDILKKTDFGRTILGVGAIVLWFVTLFVLLGLAGIFGIHPGAVCFSFLVVSVILPALGYFIGDVLFGPFGVFNSKK